MSLSFTDFKISLGITGSEKDAEYASILRGLIRELYTIYGIALDIDTNQTIEDITVVFDTPIQLTYKNIVNLSIPTFIEGTDYTLDRDEGTITVLSSGSMLEQDYAVSYSYYVFINESNEITLIKTPIENEVNYYIDVKPFTINKVLYGGVELIQDTDYFLIGNRMILVSALSNLNIPLIIKLKVGYESIPSDLKQAFYELAQYRMNRKVLNADIISRIEDNNGSSTSYRNDSIPKYIKDILMGYMGRRLAFS